MKRFFYLIVLMISATATVFAQNPVIIDHKYTDLSDIPLAWVDSAQLKLHIGYGHTSHGSQLITGMQTLEDHYSDGRFAFSKKDNEEQLHLFEGNMWSQDGYLGRDVGVVGWDAETREYLNDHPDCNVIIWSWCGEENTILERDVQTHYLDKMEALEGEYPQVQFVYMTAPLEGQGADGALKQSNDSIRTYCLNNNKILYDFADIEKYSPEDDVNYQHYGGDDACNYDPDGASPYSRTANWAEEWIAANASELLTTLTSQTVADDCSFGHTHCLNCMQKGIAAWHLWIRLAGYESQEPPADTVTHFVASSGSWHTVSNWDKGIPDDSMDAIIDAGKQVTVSSAAACDSLVVEPGASLQVESGNTISVTVAYFGSSIASGEATVMLLGNLQSSKSVWVDHIIPEGNSSMVCPVSGQTASAFLDAGLTLKTWDAASNSFVIVSESDVFLPLTAYFISNPGSSLVVRVSGSLIQGTQTVPVSPDNGVAPYKGWYATGNPYLSSVDWHLSGWEKRVTGEGLYMLAMNQEVFYSYVNGVDLPHGTMSAHISSRETFWVRANASGEFGISPEVQQPSSAAENNYAASDGVFYLQVAGTDFSKQTALYFPSSASLGFDPDFDAYYLEGPLPGGGEIYGCYTLLDDGNMLAINGYPSGEHFVGVGVRVPATGDYTLSRLSTSDYTEPIFLNDLTTHKVYDLLSETITVSLTAGRHNDRFVLSTVDTSSNTVPDTTSHFVSSSGSWHTPGNWDSGVPTAAIDAYIDAECEVIVAENAFCDSLVVHPGARLVIVEGAVLSANVVYVRSNIGGERGELKISGTLETANPGYVDVLVGSEVDAFVLPVAGSTSASFIDAGLVLKTWDAEQSAFVVVEEQDPLHVLQAYWVEDLTENIIVQVKGDLLQQDLSINITPHSGNGTYQGWYCVGNPYLSPVDWTVAGWDKSASGDAFYQYNKSLETFASFVNGVVIPAGSMDQILKPLEVFWIRANSEGTFGITSNVQANQEQSGTKNLQESPEVFILEMTGQGIDKQLGVYFEPLASEAFDPDYDACYMEGPAPGAMPLFGQYVLSGASERLAINAEPALAENWMPMGVNVPESGSYVFVKHQQSGYVAPMYLNDVVSGTVHALNEGPYTVELPAGRLDSRFVLSTVDTTSQQSGIGIIDGNINIFSVDENLWIVTQKPIVMQVEIYSLSGEKVFTKLLTVDGKQVVKTQLDGMYVVRAMNTATGVCVNRQLFFNNY